MAKKNDETLLWGAALLGLIWWYTRKAGATTSPVVHKPQRREYTPEELDDLRKYPEPWTKQPGNYWTDATGNIVPARIVALRG